MKIRIVSFLALALGACSFAIANDQATTTKTPEKQTAQAVIDTQHSATQSMAMKAQDLIGKDLVMTHTYEATLTELTADVTTKLKVGDKAVIPEGTKIKVVSMSDGKYSLCYLGKTDGENGFPTGGIFACPATDLESIAHAVEGNVANSAEPASAKKAGAGS